MNMLPLLKDEKLYYSIGEVADMFGVSKSLIRYWETEFSMQLIFDLVKNRGFTIEGAKNEIRQNKDLIKQRQALLQKLIHLKADMMKLKESLNQDGEFQHNT